MNNIAENIVVYKKGVARYPKYLQNSHGYERERGTLHHVYFYSL